MNKWRCYVCGKPIGLDFNLFSLNEETDRVFLAHTACAARLGDNPIVLHVKAIDVQSSESKGSGFGPMMAHCDEL